MTVIKLAKGIKIPGGLNDDVIIQEVLLTPSEAAKWLEANALNRPVRERHVKFLAEEIRSGNWQLNGQAIIISDGEEVLDGQHRLKAVIEAGISIRTLVIYGIKRDAFKTIDTGVIRTGGDALILHYPDKGNGIAKAVSIAVPWCYILEMRFTGKRGRISNSEILEYVKEHPSLWECCEIINGMGKDRVLSLGAGTALYEITQRKDSELADEFIRKVYTGELLEHSDPEYILRTALIRDLSSVKKYPLEIKMKMCIKAWNLRRRNAQGSRSAITIGPKDPPRIEIL